MFVSPQQANLTQNLSVNLSQIANSSVGSMSDLRISEANKKVLEEITECVSSLNLDFFLLRFRNLDFEYTDELLISTTPVSHIFDE